MDDVVQAVIDRVTAAGERHDAAQEDRLDRWRVLEPAAGLSGHVELRLDDGGVFGKGELVALRP